VAHASLTPGLAAMADRVGAALPFAKGRDLLAELAGIELSTKRVERCAEADGKAVAAAIDTHAAAIKTGELVPLTPASPVAKLYVAVDGTRYQRCLPRPRAERAKTPTGGHIPGSVPHPQLQHTSSGSRCPATRRAGFTEPLRWSRCARRPAGTAAG